MRHRHAALVLVSLCTTPVLATFPGANGRIVFQTRRSSTNGVGIVTVGEPWETFGLTGGTGVRTDMNFAPDGERIVYTVSFGVGGSLRNIVIADIANGGGGGVAIEPVNLDGREVYPRHPSFSADGDSIVYSHEGQIRRYDLISGETVPLTQRVDYYWPTVSSDNSTVAFQSLEGGIGLVPLAGGAVTFVPGGAVIPTWHPVKHEMLAVDVDFDAGVRRFLALQPSGESSVLFTAPGSSVGGDSDLGRFRVSWSPDATHIVYTAINSSGIGNTMYVVPVSVDEDGAVTTGDPVPIATEEGSWAAIRPTWAPIPGRFSLESEPTRVEVIQVGGPSIVEIPEGAVATSLDQPRPVDELVLPLFGSASIPLRVRLSDPDGDVIAGLEVSFRLTHPDHDLTGFLGFAETEDFADDSGQFALQEIRLTTDADGLTPLVHVRAKDLFDIVPYAPDPSGGYLDETVETADILAFLDGIFETPPRLEVDLGSSPGGGTVIAPVREEINVINSLRRIAEAYSEDTFHIPLLDHFHNIGLRRDPNDPDFLPATRRDDGFIVCHEFQELTLIYLNLMRHGLLTAWTPQAAVPPRGFDPARWPPVEYYDTAWLLAGIGYAPTQWEFLLSPYEHQQVAVYPEGRVALEADDFVLFFDAYWPRSRFGNPRPPVLSGREERDRTLGTRRVLLSTLPPPRSAPLDPDSDEVLTAAGGACFALADTPYPAIRHGATYYDSPFTSGCRSSAPSSPAKFMMVKHPEIIRGTDLRGGDILESALRLLVDGYWRNYDDEPEPTPVPPMPGETVESLDPQPSIVSNFDGYASSTLPIAVRTRLLGPLDAIQGAIGPLEPEAMLDATADRLLITRLHRFENARGGALFREGQRTPLIGKSVGTYPDRVVLLSPVVPLLTYPSGERWGFVIDETGSDFVIDDPEMMPYSVNLFEEADGGVGHDIISGPLEFDLTLTAIEDGVATVILITSHPEDLFAAHRLTFRDVPVTEGEKLDVTFDRSAGTAEMVRRDTGEVIVGTRDPCQLDPLGDFDRDLVCDSIDNCPNDWNVTQVDVDDDGLGDVCDECPEDPLQDEDRDGICGSADNCPTVSNFDQDDSDEDGVGDACDPCPDDQVNDPDGDGICAVNPYCEPPEPCDPFDPEFGDDCCDPLEDPECCDSGQPVRFDRLEFCPSCFDNCPDVPNPAQNDADMDGLGDACDTCPFDPTDSCEPPPVARFVRGDIDGDGALDISDPIRALLWLFGGAGIPCVAAVDVDGNSATEISDAIALLSHLFQGGDAPVAPYPACGPGESPGDSFLGCETAPDACVP